MSTPSIVDRALEQVLAAAVKVTNADRGNIQVLDATGSTLRIAIQQGFDEPFLTVFRVVRNDMCACGSALKRRQRTLVADVERSALYSTETRRAMLDASARACQSTPLVTADGLMVGIISTHFSTPHVSTVRELEQIDRLASRAAELIHRVGRAEDVAAGIQTLLDELREPSSKTRTIGPQS